MDNEALKTGITAFAALVAVASAVIAHRAKVQTRRDLFDAERNALVLSMAENDARCEHLAIQEAFARAELDRVRALPIGEVLVSEHAEWLSRIPNTSALAAALTGREYTPDALDALEYSEDGLSVLRRMKRGEDVNARLLGSATYDLIFSGVDSFAARCDKRSS